MPTGHFQRTFVIGVGMTKFEKPGRRENFDYPQMVKEAVTKALLDATLTYDSIQQAYVGYIYGDSTAGQRALYQFGMTQIPVVNVNNNCATGSTALWMARQAVKSGQANCVIAVGFEKMKSGSLEMLYPDRVNPLDWIMDGVSKTRGITRSPFAAQIFGNAGLEYCEKYGATAEDMARIAKKSHDHSTLNPYSQFQDQYTVEQILSSRKVSGGLTLPQCCPTSDGAACAIIVNEEWMMSSGYKGPAVEIISQHMATDSSMAAEEPHSSIELAGSDMTRRAAQLVYQEANISPDSIQVVELHDCFSANELITYDALGLCQKGKAHELVRNNNNTYGGNYVVNPSGGLLSKGHPLGATGLAQCCELVWQCRKQCEQRQVSNVQYALQHNIGLGGAAVVTLYKKAAFSEPAVKSHWKKQFGYNPATEAREITDSDFHKVVSKKELNIKSLL